VNSCEYSSFPFYIVVFQSPRRQSETITAILTL
jgi:hypothetical protein